MSKNDYDQLKVKVKRRTNFIDVIQKVSGMKLSIISMKLYQAVSPLTKSRKIVTLHFLLNHFIHVWNKKFE